MKLLRSLFLIISAVVISFAQELHWKNSEAEYCTGERPALLIGWSSSPPAEMNSFEKPVLLEAHRCWKWKSSEEVKRLYVLFPLQQTAAGVRLKIDSLTGAACADYSVAQTLDFRLSWEELSPLWFGAGGSLEKPSGGWLGSHPLERRAALTQNLRYLFSKFSQLSAKGETISLRNDLPLLVQELQREKLVLSLPVVEEWWGGLDSLQKRLRCPSEKVEWPNALLWEVTAGARATVTMKLSDPKIEPKWRWKGERRWKNWKGADNLFSLEFNRQVDRDEIEVLLQNSEGMGTLLRSSIPWPPLPELIEGRWFDGDGNGVADRALIRFAGVKKGDQPERLQLWWPDGTLWWSGAIHSSGRAEEGEQIWELNLPEEKGRTAGQVRAEIDWSDGRTVVYLKDGIGPVLQAAKAVPDGVLLLFSETAIGLQPEMIKFGFNRLSFPQAKLTSQGGGHWLLGADLNKLKKGMPVWLSVNGEATVVDPLGNSAPRNGVSVDLEGDFERDPSTVTTTRIDLETMVEPHGVPANAPFGAVSLSVVSTASPPEPERDDAVMEFRLLIPLVESLLQKGKSWNWSVRVFTAQGGEVAFKKGIISCSSLTAACVASPLEAMMVTIPWNLRSNTGRLVSSGSYLVQLQIEGENFFEEHIGKVGVIRRDGSEHPAR